MIWTSRPVFNLVAVTLTAQRLFSLVLLLGLFLSEKSEAQQVIYPEVDIRAEALSEQDRGRIESLKDRIVYSLQTYRVPQETTLIPKHPMRLSLQVIFHPEISRLGEFVCDIRAIAYRPVYDSEDETIVFSNVEEGVTVNPVLFNALVESNGELPSGAFFLRIHYIATLSLLLYSDSFEVNGGDTYLEALTRNAPIYRKAFEETTASITAAAQSRMLNVTEELNTEWGKTFRELWMLFHLEAIDTDLKAKGNESTFVFSLKHWTTLGEDGHIRSLMRLLTDTKTPDVRKLLEIAGDRTRSESREYAEYLFPSLRGLK